MYNNMNDYTNLKKCPGCNGPVFKFVNISDNTYHIKCGYTSMIVSDVVINGYMHKHHSTPSKKLPCDYHSILQQHELQPVYEHSKYKIYTPSVTRTFANMDDDNNHRDDNNSESDNSEDDLESCDDYNEDENEDENESEGSDISDISDVVAK